MKEEKTDFNPLIDTPLRYLAFANDVGEVCRTIVGNRLANLSWGISIGYALSDVCRSAYITKNSDKKFSEAMDTFTWQFFASILITPFLLKGKCIALEKIFHKTVLPKPIKAYCPHIITIGVGIPTFVPYCDQLVDNVMDKYYRFEPKYRDHLSHNLFWSNIMKTYPKVHPKNYF